MYDYSPLFAERSRQATAMPALDTFKQGVGEAVQLGSASINAQELETLRQGKGKALAAGAKAVGLDPNMVETLYNVDPVKAFDYVIQGTEKKNMLDAEDYVGKQMGADDYDWETKGADGADPAVGYSNWQKQQQQLISDGLNKSQSPYVRKAWEARKEKLAQSSSAAKERDRDARLNIARTGMLNTTYSGLEKRYGMDKAAAAHSTARGLDSALSSIATKIQKAEEGGKPRVSVWTQGALDAAVQTSPTLNMAREILRQYSEGKTSGIGAGLLNTLQSFVATPSSVDPKKARAAIEAAAKTNPQNLEINSLLNNALMMGVFEQIHALTGATMGETERSQYMGAFGVGGAEGVQGMLNVYAAQREKRNAEIDDAIQLALADVPHQLAPGSGAEDFDNLQARVRQWETWKMPELTPEQIIAIVGVDGGRLTLTNEQPDLPPEDPDDQLNVKPKGKRVITATPSPDGNGLGTYRK